MSNTLLKKADDPKDGGKDGGKWRKRWRKRWHKRCRKSGVKEMPERQRII